MSDNHRQIRYGLRIIVEFEADHEDDLTILDVTADQPFLAIRAGDKIWPKGLIRDGLEGQPKPFMYDSELTVKTVKHCLWEFSEGNNEMLNHSIEVVINDPYNS
jgi:hypothetical protein